MSITADRLERGSLLEIQHASSSHFKGNLIDIGSNARSLGDGHVVQIAANNMEHGNVFSLEVPSLKSGVGMEITTLDGNELSQSGTLLKVSEIHNEAEYSHLYRVETLRMEQFWTFQITKT